MKKAAGVENTHASCCKVIEKRRRWGWTELVSKQRFSKLKMKIRKRPNNANTAEEMDVRREIEKYSVDGRIFNLESFCKMIIIKLISAAVEGEFNFNC